jgi:hypothetical protein
MKFLFRPSIAYLNMAETNSAILLQQLLAVLNSGHRKITIELIGPGVLAHDVALMLHDEIKKRRPHIRIHANARTFLINGSLLLWLAADTRSIRRDAWIQLSEIPKSPPSAYKTIDRFINYPTSIEINEETAARTDMRTIISYLEEYIPVDEIAGLRIFEPDIRDLGLLESREEVIQISKPRLGEAFLQNVRFFLLKSALYIEAKFFRIEYIYVPRFKKSLRKIWEDTPRIYL